MAKAVPFRASAGAAILSIMQRLLAMLLLACAMPASAQLLNGPGAPGAPPPHKAAPARKPKITQGTSHMETLEPLNFLLGTWSAKATENATANAKVIGLYTFHKDLDGHAIQRSSTADTCSGPTSDDCNHHDVLTIFPDANALPSEHKAMVFALYLDNEGHAIYYMVNSPEPNTAVFQSQGPPTVPVFRLTYHLDTSGTEPTMSGKFEVAAPGTEQFHVYQQWTGTRQ
jgi:hypothetical protein